MTTGKTIALTRWTFIDKAMSLLFNMLSRLVIAFPKSKHLLISWLQSLSAVIFAVQGTLKTKSNDSSVLNFLYSPALISIHDYWKNLSLA